MAVVVDVLAFEPPRQVHVLHEHVVRVHALAASTVRPTAGATAQVT